MSEQMSYDKYEMPSVRLSDLAIACYIYEGMSNADESYEEFREATKPALDLNRAKHRTALITWLNKWGCRQFATDDHRLASSEIEEWYKECRRQLPPRETTLLELSATNFNAVHVAYGKLASRKASERNTKNGSRIDVKVGPTGAAKILFAVRPQALMPWDESIRKRFGLNDSADSYTVFLEQVKTRLEELGKVCERHGHKLSELPTLVKRPRSTLVKLIDEYLWVTITNKCKAPTNQILEQWMEWTNWS